MEGKSSLCSHRTFPCSHKDTVEGLFPPLTPLEDTAVPAEQLCVNTSARPVFRVPQVTHRQQQPPPHAVHPRTAAHGHLLVKPSPEPGSCFSGLTCSMPLDNVPALPLHLSCPQVHLEPPDRDPPAFPTCSSASPWHHPEHHPAQLWLLTACCEHAN